MKLLLLLALCSTAVPAWSASTQSGSTVTASSILNSTCCVYYSTASCPATENGIWIWTGIEPQKTVEYEWAWIGRYFDEEQEVGFYLWRKVPYKIDWVCMEMTYQGPRRCIRELGYREDGVVIWRNP